MAGSRRRRCGRCWPHSRHDRGLERAEGPDRHQPVDFRKGMDGLAALVKAHPGTDPFSGTVFVFRAKRANRIKLIVWDGTGPCLFARRREEGTFRWPKIEDGIMRLTPAQLSALTEGLDWTRVRDAGVRAPTAVL
ncbi:MAG: IS66 family insertion sequence element accessory protein TnpB [Pseudomonadota bacterium]